MDRPLVLDTTPLSLLCHPNMQNADVAACNRWLRAHLAAGTDVYLPEIADYELRRELLHRRSLRSLQTLDSLKAVLTHLSITSAAMLRAAEIWAEARRRGISTAPAGALDGDVILAALAETVGGLVATGNARHLARFTTAEDWRQVLP